MSKCHLTIDEIIDIVLVAPQELRQKLVNCLVDDQKERSAVELEIEAFELSQEPLKNAQERRVVNRLPNAPLDNQWARKQLGEFELVSRIGKGGFGEVWEARQPLQDSSRTVAIKILLQPNAEFRREVTSLASCSHSNVVSLFGEGKSGEHSYLAMEYFPNGELLTFCNENAYNLEDRLKTFIGVCEGVEHLHRNKIIHYDIKPNNILVNADGIPKIADFGLAGQEAGESLSILEDINQLAVRGTIGYASPEALDICQIADTRTDVYSLGMLLIKMLLGRTPHEIHVEQEAKQDSAGDKSDLPREPSQLANFVPTCDRVLGTADLKRLPGDLDAILRKATEHDREQRYSSVAEFKSDIEAFLTNNCVTARQPPPPLYRTRQFIRRSPLLAAALFGLFLLAVFLTKASYDLFLSNGALTLANTRISNQVVELEESNRKERAATQEAVDGRKRIQAQANNLKSINEVLQTVFEGFNPYIVDSGEGALRGELVGRLSRVAHEIMEKQLGMDDDGLEMKKHLAETLNTLGQVDLSALLWKHILRDSTDRKGRLNNQTLIAYVNLGRTQLRSDPHAAEENLLEAKQIAKELRPDGHPGMSEIDHILAAAHSRTGDVAAAAELFDSLIEQAHDSEVTTEELYIDLLNSQGTTALKLQDFEIWVNIKPLIQTLLISPKFFAKSTDISPNLQKNSQYCRSSRFFA